jgi:kynureninase
MQFSQQHALEQDQNDTLKEFREKFFIPTHNGKQVSYFCGNSLGLQPKTVSEEIQQELNYWATLGVEGHFNAQRPWFKYHEYLTPSLAKIVGAKNSEVVAMNQLTANIHFLLATFYKPTAQKFKILCEAKAFPSDQYALASQVEWHNYTSHDAIIEVAPYQDSHTINTSQIIEAIEKNHASLALVFIGGVNYYTGQVFDMQAITQCCKKYNIAVGYDLAHAAGNIKLELHNWEVDFAAWCSYKYLNSGPGSVGGAFVHEKHHTANHKRLAGWWGHNKEERFKMEKNFVPIETAEGWQLSNAPVLSMAAHIAALKIFDQAGIENLHAKRVKMSAYLQKLLHSIKDTCNMQILTPENESEYGCQVSMYFKENGKKYFDHLQQNSIVADWREPGVIRVAAVPLYNSFSDCFTLYNTLKNTTF